MSSIAKQNNLLSGITTDCEAEQEPRITGKEKERLSREDSWRLQMAERNIITKYIFHQ